MTNLQGRDNALRGHFPLDEYPLDRNRRVRPMKVFIVALYGINEDNRDHIPGGTQLFSCEVRCDTANNAESHARGLHDASLKKKFPGYESKLFCGRLMWRADVKR